MPAAPLSSGSWLPWADCVPGCAGFQIVYLTEVAVLGVNKLEMATD